MSAFFVLDVIWKKILPVDNLQTYLKSNKFLKFNDKINLINSWTTDQVPINVGH